MFTNAAGCDSTAVLSLTIKQPTTSTTAISTCVSYTWNGTTYSSSNSYTKMFTNAVGCDSTAVLSITIKQPTTSTTTINVCPAQLPYNWNGVIINATGSQTVHLTNAAGCDSSATLNLTVSSTSTSFNTASICSIQLPYVWNGQNLNISGDYSITLPNANSQGCDSIVRLHLIVNQSPLNPSTTLLITYCQFDLSSQLSASGNYPPMLWYNSPTGLNNTTNAPYPSTNLPGTYQYYVSQNNGNCESPRTNIKVVVNSKPELQKDTTLRICYGTTANLQILFNTTGLNFSWTTNNTPVYNPYNIAIGGIYQLIATNSAGCIDTAVVNLIIQPKVIANAGNDDNASINTPYQLSGSGGGTYLWSPSFVLDNPTLANPTAILNSDTRFYLTVKDNWGCTDLDSVLIKVYNGQSFYVPNAFTPDGDGLNDLFRPTYVGIKKLDYFRVYNRYGVLIFETNDIGRGWDGRYKGVRQNLDNYIFIVKAIDKFGYDKVMKGNILLLR